MNTPIAATAALLLFFWIWFGRRRGPVLLRSTDTAAIAALNRAQIVAVQSPVDPGPPPPVPCGSVSEAAPAGASDPSGPCWAVAELPGPADAAGRARLLRLLDRGLRGDAASRLLAVRTARAWGHAASLPLLRRALRDVNPAVVHEAAQALDRFRGRVDGAKPLFQLPAALPRNVALTR